MKLLDLLKLKPNPGRREFFRTMGAGAVGVAAAATIKPEEAEAVEVPENYRDLELSCCATGPILTYWDTSAGFHVPYDSRTHEVYDAAAGHGPAWRTRQKR